MKVLNTILKVITAALVIIGGLKLLGAIGSLELEYITCAECIKYSIVAGLYLLGAHIIHEVRLCFCIDPLLDEIYYKNYYNWDSKNYR